MLINRRFDRGGAERQLIELVKNIDKSRFDVCVATFYEGGALYPQIEAVPGVQLVSLRKGSRWDTIGFLWRFWRAMRECQPQIIVGYLSVPNLLSLAAGRLGGAKVVWAIRNSNMDMSRYDWLSRVTARMECWLSHGADLVIFNSHAGRDHYVRCGFPEKSAVVIPNGIDTDYFRPDAGGRKKIRQEWGIGEKTPLIGMVARMDPMKDHRSFLYAAAELVKERSDVHFVFIGDGAPAYRAELIALAEKLGLVKSVIWTHGRNDMREVYSAFDIMSLSSAYGEGFPNVIGEAMACGVACVVTNVGDAAEVVGKTGFVIRPQSPARLVEKWKEMLDQTCEAREARAEAAKRRIYENFSVATLATRTESSLKTLIN